MNSNKLRPDEKLQFPLIIVNYDSGLNVIKANSKALELFGQSLKSLKDLVDKPESPIFIDEEGKPLTLEMLPEYQVLEKGKSIENQIVGVFSQSSLKYSWFEVCISPQTMHNNQCTEIRAIYKEIPEFFNSNNSLINTKRRYQRVLENIDNLVFQFLFVPEFKINYISSNVHHFYGYNSDEFYKNPSLIKEVIHPDDLNLLALSRDEKFENDKTVRFRLVGRDAQIIWVDGVFYPEINDKGQLVSLEGIVQNITDDILAKDELERKQNLIDSILYNLEGFAYRCNYSQNCEITYISEHIEKLTGYKISDFNINKTISLRDLIFEDDRDFVKGKIDSAVKENQPWSIEYRIRKKSGKKIWVIESGVSAVNDRGEIMLDGFIKNNNEDKARHDQLMLQKQQYENIIYNTNVGTWRWNIQTGETTFNERWAQILGYTLAELEPINIETWTRLTHPIDLKKSEKLLKDHLDGLSEFYENEIRMRHKDGHWVWILDTGMVINKSKEGEPMLLSGIHQDISSRKQLEVNLRQKLHFEKALATISKEFIASPDIDDAINMALKQLGTVTSASRIYVFLLKNNNSVMDNTHEWCANGVSPQMDNLKDLDVNIFPWWMDKLNKGEIIQIADVGQLPPEASAEKEILESQEIKSLIVIGLRVNGKLAGFVGFDNVSAEMTGWSLEELNLLLWLVQIFSNALESRAAKEKLRKSELKFRNIFELNPSPQILIDPTNGDILELNQAALVFYGYRHNDLLKMNFLKLSGVNEEKTHKKFKTKLKELVNNSYYQIRQKTHSGIFRELELFSGIITIDDVEILHVIMHDITEKIRMSDRNQLLRTAVDCSPFGILITDINGVIEEVNPTILQSTGYQVEELIGKNARIFNSGQQGNAFFSQLWNTILSGKTWSGEIENKKKNGELFWENMSIVPIFNEFGDLIKFVSLKENITDKIRMMQDLIEAKNEAEESNRLKSAFLSTINHELRTPLNHVIGISSIINEMATDETIKEFSYIVHRSGIHLLEIIEDILNLALADQMTIKSKEEKILVLDIYMFLKDSLYEIHNKSGVQDQINIRLAPETRILNFEFRSDRSKINMIMLNLFKNAIKFTSRGFVEFGFNSSDTHLNFFVRDSGIGIPADKQDIIFDFFRQVNDTDTRQHDGLGVGLAIAKKSADSIGAELVVHSELGKGSEFILKIPQIPQPIYRNQSYQDDEAAISINLSDKVILLVDDDVDSLLVSHMLLKQTNAQILEARNGIEAIEVFQNNKIDLILMDLKMPLMDGYKATTLIKSERKDIPIIGLTSYSFLDDQLKAKAAGCDDIITKPLDKRILFSQLKQYLIR